MKQITNTILMVRPTHFRSNEQTAVNNYYQKVVSGKSAVELQGLANREFDDFVAKLREAGIQVIVFESKDGLDTPDAHFPNNWISFHENGVVGLYPMFAENRRLERREAVLDQIEMEGFKIDYVVDYSSAEDEGFFLEGTGSLVLDRVNKKAYCALSPRADEGLFIEFCEDFDYFPIVFTANQNVDGKREPIYHTNVMMCLAEDFAVICLNSIDDKKERKNVVKHLKESSKEIIDVSEHQLTQFAGNMLQLRNTEGESFIVMSQAALDSLSADQIERLKNYGTILASSLNIIEACGGGSARCMIAEVFLKKN